MTHVIDANIFIHGASRTLPFDDMVTVPAVTAELETFQAQQRFEAQDIDIQEPSEESVTRVSEKAQEIDAGISDTDTALVALALQLDAVLVTDDYEMQNIASQLDVETESFLQEGIQEEITWKRVCPNCGKEVDSDTCPVCGAATKKVSH